MVLPYQYNKVLGQVLRTLWYTNLIGKVGGKDRKQDDIDAMTSALLNAHAQSVMSIGAEDSETIGGSSSNGGSTAFEAFDNVLTRRIQKVVLGQTLTSGTDGVGSRALGEVHNDVRLDKRNSDLRMITPTIQELIDALCLLNNFEKHTIVLVSRILRSLLLIVILSLKH
jgi:phage gp29-like protein